MATHILKQDSRLLQNLLIKLEELKKFNNLFSQHLESPLAQHCHVVRYEKNCLIVLVDNATWGTQLRFRIPDVIKQLHQYPVFENLQAICSKIRPLTLLDSAVKNGQ